MVKKLLKIHLTETRGLYQGRRLEGKVKNTSIKPIRKAKQKK
ncbi:MAG: hypothetical protein WA101_00250 [Minisyncoccia bacterium]